MFVTGKKDIVTVWRIYEIFFHRSAHNKDIHQIIYENMFLLLIIFSDLK